MAKTRSHTDTNGNIQAGPRNNTDRKIQSVSEGPYFTSRHMATDDVIYKSASSPRKKSACWNRGFVCLTFLFFLTTVALLAILLWRELRQVDKPLLSDVVKSRFQGYFRTPEDQRIFETEAAAINIPTNETIVNDTDAGAGSCYMICVPREEFVTESSHNTTPTLEGDLFTYPPTSTSLHSTQRQKRQVDVTTSVRYHGCCISTPASSTPNIKQNKDKKVRKLVQFDSLRQYFPEPNCRQARDCFGGQCHYEKTLHTAVVFKEGVIETDDVDDLEIDWFYFNSCCKSVNT